VLPLTLREPARRLRRSRTMSPLEENLRATLSMVNEWLRYAEAKNAVLIGAHGALIFGLTQLEIQGESWASVRNASAGLMAASLLIAAVSLTPWLARPGLFPTRAGSSEDNLIFFGDAAHHDADTYLNYLSAAQPGLANGDKVAHWLAEQIVINSRIASRKFRLFNLALYAVALGIAGIGSMVAAGFHTK
jgi:Family of unknown function (DUF5706)